MKTFGKCLAILAVGLSSAASAADVTIVVTGSTALRGSTHQSILNDLTANGDGGAVQYGYVGGTLGAASQAIFKRSYNGDNVIVKTHWSGSVEGIRALASDITVPVLPDATPVSTGGTGSASAATTATVVANIAIADNLPAATAFVGEGFNELTSTPVAILPFKWIANNGSQALNITPLTARAILGAGRLRKSFFTGVLTDNTNNLRVYAYGRNFGSGTRVIQLSEIGYGVANPVVQYEASTTTSTQITAQAVTAAGTVLGQSVSAGDNGYSSGGTLADIMRRSSGTGTNINPSTIIIAPMGLDDANRATAPTGVGNGPAVECTYNGVAYSEDNVKSGRYSYWSNGQLLYRTAEPDGTVKTFADRVAADIATVTAPIKDADMQVSRSSDGGTITAK